MGDNSYQCPLCCKLVFNTKQALVEHLLIILSKLKCPVCKTSSESLLHLINHLSTENCSLEDDNANEPQSYRQIKKENVNILKSNESNLTVTVPLEFETFDSDNNQLSEYNKIDPLLSDEESISTNSNKIIVELIDKQLKTPFFGTHEFALLKENETKKFVLISDGNEATNIITTKNSDGTISLTTENAKEDATVKEEPKVNNHDVPEGEEEIYSCNTCGISFTNIQDHIQNYHNDQEVVVEEPMEINEISLIDIETDDDDPLEDNDKNKKNQYPTVKNVFSVPKGVLPTVHQVTCKHVKTLDGNVIKVFNCRNCNFYGTTLNLFKEQPCKNSKPKYECSQCTVSYSSQKSLSAHMKVHKNHTWLADTTRCEICLTVLPTLKSLKLHRRMHDPVKQPTVEVVDADGNEFFNVKKYHCPVCEKDIPVDFKVIHDKSHGEETQYNCDICNKKFSSSEYLEMHMNVHKLGKVIENKTGKTLPYKCMYCKKQFARPHEKIKHERIHTGEKPHECEICGKSFRVLYCLTLHMRTHTGARPYDCPHCPKRFKTNSVFNHHLLTHSDVRAYKCTFCPKTFKTSVQLAGHKNSHTKPFSCQQCNRPFASLYAVRVHTETHGRQNNLRYKCEFCGATYAREFALRDHMKNAHADSKEVEKDSSGEKEDEVDK